MVLRLLVWAGRLAVALAWAAAVWGWLLLAHGLGG